jgi:hypothetical protein
MYRNHLETGTAVHAGAAILFVVTSVALGSSSVTATPAAAATPGAGGPQTGRNFEAPPTWQIRYDAGSVGERVYEVMRPGWHIHPGPAAILWDAGCFASGNYSVSSTIFLFPAGQGDPPSEVEAPYGLLLAGEGLEGAAAGYVSFLLRNDGTFRVARHTGDRVQDLVPWTAHDALAVWTESSDGAAKNVLAMDATADSVTFWVNDERVASVPRAELSMEGIAGLCAGADLSLHITDIAIGPNRR